MTKLRAWLWYHVLEKTTLHNGMIMSTLSISSRGFAFGFSKRPHTNGDVFPTYKLMIIPLISQCGTPSQQSSTILPLPMTWKLWSLCLWESGYITSLKKPSIIIIISKEVHKFTWSLPLFPLLVLPSYNFSCSCFLFLIWLEVLSFTSRCRARWFGLISRAKFGWKF